MQEVQEGKDYSFPKEEEKILGLWKELDAFHEQLRRSEGKPEYVFFDGPPFATGLPHYGHILAGTLKVGCSVGMNGALQLMHGCKRERNIDEHDVTVSNQQRPARMQISAPSRLHDHKVFFVLSFGVVAAAMPTKTAAAQGCVPLTAPQHTK